ncbi:hypothetical protein C791_7429 [Amycolatopsis azurea DSM 43854]|uniref:Uncharacterized protein n=1 Tax=Amycolatopsis azurea DSM 43854 TaxID=1238180 RepID=M2NM08_9PSEU|nr:hypothetical protein C791_7429 [Amycolatopsis azurea DSM 43854]
MPSRHGDSNHRRMVWSNSAGPIQQRAEQWRYLHPRAFRRFLSAESRHLRAIEMHRSKRGMETMHTEEGGHIRVEHSLSGVSPSLRALDWRIGLNSAPPGASCRKTIDHLRGAAMIR